MCLFVCTYVNVCVESACAYMRVSEGVCYLDRAEDCSPDIPLEIPGRRREGFCPLRWCRCVCDCGSLWHSPECKLTTSPTMTSQSLSVAHQAS